jgi:hypothetical protein
VHSTRSLSMLLPYQYYIHAGATAGVEALKVVVGFAFTPVH